MYEYKVNIIKIVGMWIKDERVRMMGIDTPESRTRDKVEKKFGLASKERLKSLLGKTGILKTQVNKKGEDMKGKFGRILGDFVVDGKMATEILIKEGHAVKYFGGSKEEIQAKHMKNRDRLIKEGVVKP